MKRFWMIGAAVIAVSTAVAAWNCPPVNAANELLAKAQTEFAIKAREAFMQRGMMPTSAETEIKQVSETVHPQPAQPRAVASDAPVPLSPPTIAVSNGTAPVNTLVSPMTDSMQAAADAAPSISQPKALTAPAREKDEVPRMVAPTTSPASEKAAIAPASPPPPPPLAATVVSEVPAVASTASSNPVKPDEGTRAMPSRPKVHTATRRVERETPRHDSRYNIDALRARAPGIAAAIESYM